MKAQIISAILSLGSLSVSAQTTLVRPTGDMTLFSNSSATVHVEKSFSLPMVARKDKLLDLQVQALSVNLEGYDGDELIVSEKELPPPAVPAVIPAGFTDVTRLAVDRKFGDKDITYALGENEKRFKVVIIAPRKSLSIRVPKQANLMVMYSSSDPIGTVEISKLEGETQVNIALCHPPLFIHDITGPLTVNYSDFHGRRATGAAKVVISGIDWKAFQAKNSKGWFYINSLNADVDLALPKDLKASVQAYAPAGGVFSDLKISEAEPSSPSPDLPKIRQGYTLNGGGLSIFVNSQYGNVYLRREK